MDLTNASAIVTGGAGGVGSTDEELAELFAIFEIEARCNHHEKTL